MAPTASIARVSSDSNPISAVSSFCSSIPQPHEVRGDTVPTNPSALSELCFAGLRQWPGVFYAVASAADDAAALAEPARVVLQECSCVYY